MKKINNYYLEMHTHYLDIPYYHTKRRVRVLLPKDYNKEEWANYPVLYMFDGQNVFYSKEAFSGYSWKLIPTIKNNTHLPKFIVVGIDNAGEKRLDEYSPWQTDSTRAKEFLHCGGDGDKHIDWLVTCVKPFIDDNYRTKTDKNATLIAGSSMGGIMAAYAAAKYKDIFGHIGVFSLASWFSERDFLRFIAHHQLAMDTKVYIQVGTKEGDDTDKHFLENMNQAYIDVSINYYQTLIKNGLPLDNIWFRILAGEEHHEKYWAEHFLEFLEFSFNQIKK